MLKNIEIKGLFGRFNYKLDFEGKEIVILTGPNGFGKSTILRIVEAIANNSVFYLLKIEFKEIKFCFESENEDIFFTLTKNFMFLINIFWVNFAGKVYDNVMSLILRYDASST